MSVVLCSINLPILCNCLILYHYHNDILAVQVITGVEVTVGSDSDPAAQVVNAMGGKHIAKKVTVSCPVTHTHMCTYNTVFLTQG